MRVIIHCGLPKTGTTAIQDWFAEHSQLLQSRNILYPEEFPSSKARFHRFLIHELRTQSGMKLTERIIMSARQQGIETLILSIEGITAHIDKIRPDMAKRLQKILGNDHLDIVVTLRSFQPWVRSIYRQCVITPPIRDVRSGHSNLERQYGCTLTLDEFSSRKDIIEIADQCAIQSRLKEMFPEASINFLEHGEKLLETFLCFVKLPVPITSADNKFRNSSIPDSFIKLLQLANHWSKNAEIDKSIRAAINQNLTHDHVHLGLYKFDSKPSLELRALFAFVAMRIFLNGLQSGLKIFGAKRHCVNKSALEHCRASVKVSLSLLWRAIALTN